MPCKPLSTPQLSTGNQLENGADGETTRLAAAAKSAVCAAEQECVREKSKITIWKSKSGYRNQNLKIENLRLKSKTKMLPVADIFQLIFVGKRSQNMFDHVSKGDFYFCLRPTAETLYDVAVPRTCNNNTLKRLSIPHECFKTHNTFRETLTCGTQ